MKRTAFVTGGSGFLGRTIIEVLLEQDWQVTALHRTGSRTGHLRCEGVSLAEGGLDQPQLLARLIPEGADAVFHVAGDTSMWRPANQRQWASNVLGTRNMVDAALLRHVGRFVHTSSIVVYGFHDGVIDERSQHRGEHSWIGYFRSKARAEHELRSGIERGLDAVLLNPAVVIGRYDHSNWSRAIRMVHDGSLPGVPPGASSFAHSRAVAEAHVAAVDRGTNGSNYLLGGVDASFFELIQTIARLVDRPQPRRATPALLLRTVGRLASGWSRLSRREPDLTAEGAALVCGSLICSNQQAVDVLGYRPVDLETMVTDCVHWMRTEGMLE